MTDTRIVLVKPGDVLIIGNVGATLNDEAIDHLADGLSGLKESLGLAGIVLFAEDIDLAAVRDALPVSDETANPGHSV